MYTHITHIYQSDEQDECRGWGLESVQDDRELEALRLCNDWRCLHCDHVVQFNVLGLGDQFDCDDCGTVYEVNSLLPFEVMYVEMPDEYDYSYNDF